MPNWLDNYSGTELAERVHVEEKGFATHSYFKLNMLDLKHLCDSIKYWECAGGEEDQRRPLPLQRFPHRVGRQQRDDPRRGSADQHQRYGHPVPTTIE